MFKLLFDASLLLDMTAETTFVDNWMVFFLIVGFIICDWRGLGLGEKLEIPFRSIIFLFFSLTEP